MWWLVWGCGCACSGGSRTWSGEEFGAVLHPSECSVKVLGCRFVDITSADNGGAISYQVDVVQGSDGSLTCNSTEFVNCRAQRGGGIAAQCSTIALDGICCDRCVAVDVGQVLSYVATGAAGLAARVSMVRNGPPGDAPGGGSGLYFVWPWRDTSQVQTVEVSGANFTGCAVREEDAGLTALSEWIGPYVVHPTVSLSTFASCSGYSIVQAQWLSLERCNFVGNRVGGRRVRCAVVVGAHDPVQARECAFIGNIGAPIMRLGGPEGKFNLSGCYGTDELDPIVYNGVGYDWINATTSATTWEIGEAECKLGVPQSTKLPVLWIGVGCGIAGLLIIGTIVGIVVWRAKHASEAKTRTMSGRGLMPEEGQAPALW